MSEQKRAEALARWLKAPPGTPPPEDLDPEVVESVYALNPERAPAPRVTVDEILAGVQRGPLSAPLDGGPAGEVVAFPGPSGGAPPREEEPSAPGEPSPDASTPGGARRWGTVGAVVAVAAVALLMILVRPPAPESTHSPMVGAAPDADLDAVADLEEVDPRGEGDAWEVAEPEVAPPARVARRSPPPVMKPAPRPRAVARPARAPAPPMAAPPPPAPAPPEPAPEPMVASAPVASGTASASRASSAAESGGGVQAVGQAAGQAESRIPEVEAELGAVAQADAFAEEQGARGQRTREERAMEADAPSAAMPESMDGGAAKGSASLRDRAVPTDLGPATPMDLLLLQTASQAQQALARGETRAALDQIRPVLEAHPAPTAARSSLLVVYGDALRAAGDEAAAEAAWREAIEANEARRD